MAAAARSTGSFRPGLASDRTAQWNRQHPHWAIDEGVHHAASQPAAALVQLIRLLQPLPSELDPSTVHPAANISLASPTRCELEPGAALGRNRVVRSFAPFPSTPKELKELPIPNLFTKLYAHGARPAGPLRVQPGGKKVSCAAGSTGYFEVSIGEEVAGSPAVDQLVSIGLVPQQMRSTGSQPGWVPHSFGYHSDDGHVFTGSGRGQEFGPQFGAGDTVGCGVDFVHNIVFFTLNGSQLEPHLELKVPCVPLFPCIGVDCLWTLEVNFGQQPFAFDIQAYDRQLSADTAEHWQSGLTAALECSGRGSPEHRETHRCLPQSVGSLQQCLAQCLQQSAQNGQQAIVGIEQLLSHLQQLAVELDDNPDQQEALGEYHSAEESSEMSLGFSDGDEFEEDDLDHELAEALLAGEQDSDDDPVAEIVPDED